jgi:hypothetical protein
LVDKVALEQDFVWILQYSSVGIILPWLHTHIIWVMNNRPIAGCSWET